MTSDPALPSPIPTTAQLCKESYGFLMRYRYPVLSTVVLLTLFSSLVLGEFHLNAISSNPISMAIGQVWFSLLLSFLLADKAQAPFSIRACWLSSCQLFFPLLGITVVKLAATILCMAPALLFVVCFYERLVSQEVEVLLLTAFLGLLGLLAIVYMALRLSLADAFFGLRKAGIFSALRSSWIASKRCWSKLLFLLLLGVLMVVLLIGIVWILETIAKISLSPENLMDMTKDNPLEARLPLETVVYSTVAIFFWISFGFINAFLFQLAASLNHTATRAAPAG